MATLTAKLGLSKPADGEAGWGAMMRTNLDILDAAAAGQNCPKVLTGGTYTLTATEGLCDSFEISGTLVSALIIVVPNNMPPFSVENLTTGGFTVSIKTALGTAFVLPTGVSLFYANGTNVERIYSPTVGQLISTATTAIAATATKVALGGVAYNSGGITCDTANSRLTCVNPGTYEIRAEVGALTTSVIQSLTAVLYKNGVAIPVSQFPTKIMYCNAAQATYLSGSMQGILDLVAGDFLEIFANGSAASGCTMQIGHCALSARHI